MLRRAAERPAHYVIFSLYVADAPRPDPYPPAEAFGDNLIGIPGGLTTMLRRRYRACVALLTAAFVISNLGCSTGVFRQAIRPSDSATAQHVTLPSQAAVEQASPSAYVAPHTANVSHQTDQSDAGVAQAQYSQPWESATLTMPSDYDNVNLDVEQVVRGQGYYNGPLKETLLNPYVIGAAIIAGIAIPLAVENRDFPVGGP